MRRRGLLACLAVLGVLLAVLPAQATTGTTVTPGVVTGSGLGFDACVAPSTATLRAWSASPYTSVNIYFSGSQRGCPNQPNLTADWVTTVLSNGWSLIPTVVDLQAPCNGGSTKSKMSTDPVAAGQQGAAAAQQADTDLRNLGLGGGVAYLDIENFDIPSGDTTCGPAVQSFVSSYTTTLHGLGDLSGVYFNAHHGAQTLLSMWGQPGQPDDVWLADWNGVASADGSVLAAGDARWLHHRIHQYFSDNSNGTGSETYAGLTIGVDRNAIDGDVVAATSVSVNGYNVSAPGTGLKQRTTPNYDSDANVVSTIPDGTPLPIACQATGEATNLDGVWDRLSDGTYVHDLYTTTTGQNSFSATIAKCDTTRPTATVKPLPFATTASSLTVRWTSADATDANHPGETRGISQSMLRYRFASWHGGFGAWHYRATTASSSSLALSVGYDYCVQVQTKDLSGNASAWSQQQCVARALDDRSMSASTKSWTRRTGSHFYAHTATDTKRSGVTISRTKAQLRRVGIVATTCKACGAVRVYVAGHYVGTIDLRSSTTHYRRVSVLSGFSYRTGTVTLKTTGSRLVQIDGLVVARA